MPQLANHRAVILACGLLVGYRPDSGMGGWPAISVLLLRTLIAYTR